MRVNIDIEQYDNGITLKWRDLDGETDPQNTVALGPRQGVCMGE